MVVLDFVKEEGIAGDGGFLFEFFWELGNHSSMRRDPLEMWMRIAEFLVAPKLCMHMSIFQLI